MILNPYATSTQKAREQQQVRDGLKTMSRILKAYFKIRTRIVYSESALLQSIRHKLVQYRMEHRKTQNEEWENVLNSFSRNRRIGLIFDVDTSGLYRIISELLEEIGIRVTAVSASSAEYEDIPYVVIGAPSFLKALPKVYFFYQLGDLNNCRIPRRICSIMHGSVAVLESRLENITKYGNRRLKIKRKYYVPVDIGSENRDGFLTGHVSRGFKFYFLRFLLAFDLISFDLFYEKAGRDFLFLPENGRICLSLPESVERRRVFDSRNGFGFHVLPGLCHRTGWYGCALSYKFFFRKAMEEKRQQLMICEDDVVFPCDFENQLTEIKDYLKSKDWDVFSGVMANAVDVNIKGVETVSDNTFIATNFMISLVCNIYNVRAIAIGASWDESKRENNAIDGYFNVNNPEVIVRIPFLVGHDESLDSTVWGFSNSRYSEMIVTAQNKLLALADKHIT